MKNRLAAAALTAGVVGGLGVGLVLGPGVALGQSSTPAAPPDEQKVRLAPGRHLADALAPLVADGTLTQAQLDKVLAALRAARPELGPGRHRGHHKLHIALEKVAAQLGITEAALREALRSGQSIADVAKSKNVAVQTVIDALVADARTRLAAKVTAGDITQAQADERLADMTERITGLVNGELPKWVGRPGRRAVRPDSTQPSTSNTVLRSA